MEHVLTDLSQLSKAMLKKVPAADEVKIVPPASKRDKGVDVLAYFARSAETDAGGQETGHPAEAALEREKAARLAAEEQLAVLAREKDRIAAALEKAQKENGRLTGECARLQGEARKAATIVVETKGDAAKLPPAPAMGDARKGLLTPPASFDEAFPGEVREMVLAALADARDAARQGIRERRAAVLDAVLAANHPTGELERRRMEIKQAMKDCGYYTDPKALERLGFRLVSGRTHWKLEYGTVRMPIAKTPSDYRANLNMATDLANRCL